MEESGVHSQGFSGYHVGRLTWFGPKQTFELSCVYQGFRICGLVLTSFEVEFCSRVVEDDTQLEVQVNQL
jgi:hypothetical protein